MSTATQLIIAGGLLLCLLTWIAILDIARKDFGTIENKKTWLIISMVPFIGFIVYFIIGYKKGTPKSKLKPE